MVLNRQLYRCSIFVMLVIVSMQIGCTRLQLPAFDPTGNRLFSNGTTQLLTPGTTTGTCLGLNPLRAQSPANLGGVFQPAPFSPPATRSPQYPVQPAFQHPETPPPCNELGKPKAQKVKHVIPRPSGRKTPGQNGQLIMTPSRIVAPVGSEVVVLAGICGGDGYFVKNQPLEWMLSNNSVGELIEVGGMNHSAFNRLVPPSARKFDGSYAWGRTGLKKVLLSRGTPTPVDDIELAEGQTFVSVSSASPGTSYITGVAPKAEGWDRRRSSSIIHWVDGQWSIPAPASATAGTVYPLTTVVNRATDGGGVEDWVVRYEIVGGAPAEFAPTGSKTAETKTGKDGRATVQIRQVAGQFEPGTTQIRTDVVRPAMFGEPELVVESGITSVTWSAPALTIRAIGPRVAGANEPFNYRIEVTNPGDQVARGVVVRTKDLDESIEYISSTPKPTEYGRQLEWTLGDIPPGGQARVIDLQMKSQKRGNTGLCFEVASETDRLRTEACAETEIAVPCIGFDIEGPTTANVGDVVDLSLNVKNECDEPLEDIQLTIRYDQGLVFPGYSNPAKFQFSELQFGESRPFPLQFNVQAAGTRCFEVEISAKGGHTSSARRCIEVSQGTGINNGSSTGSQNDSRLELGVTGARPIEIGGQSVVDIQVVNRSNVPLENAVLTNRFSSSVEPISVTKGYNADFLGDELAVNLGRLNPNEAVNVRLVYEGRSVDGDAVTEYTVSTPSGASATEKISIRVEPTGSLPVQPDFGNGGLGNGGNGSGPIGIPPESAQQQGNLSVDVRTINRNIQLINSAQPDANLQSESQIEFVIKNNGRSSLREVDITLLVPKGIKLTKFDRGETGLSLVNRNDDFTQFYLNRANELRAGEELRFVATVVGDQPGLATFEVKAESPDVIAGPSVGRDTVIVSQ